MFEVEVAVPGRTLVLTDTIVLLTDRGELQLTTGLELGAQGAQFLKSTSELVLMGDYDDAISVTLRPKFIEGLPVTVAALYAVYESIGDLGKQYFVGIFVEDETKGMVLGICIHLDDIVAAEADVFWRYVRAITPTCSRITIERHPPIRTR